MLISLYFTSFLNESMHLLSSNITDDFFLTLIINSCFVFFFFLYV